jgi:curved DNA-binding protein CbpA
MERESEMNKLTYYDLLQTTENADAETITVVYRSLIKRHHPDVSTNPKANDIAQKLNQAYAILSDPVRRAKYDGELRRTSQHGPKPARRETAESSGGSQADAIRRHVIRRCISPSRNRQVSEITIRAGAVHNEMGLNQRIPNVCQLLGGEKLAIEAGIRLIRKAGPKASPNSTFTFRQ